MDHVKNCEAVLLKPVPSYQTLLHETFNVRSEGQNQQGFLKTQNKF